MARSLVLQTLCIDKIVAFAEDRRGRRSLQQRVSFPFRPRIKSRFGSCADVRERQGTPLRHVHLLFSFLHQIFLF